MKINVYSLKVHIAGLKSLHYFKSAIEEVGGEGYLFFIQVVELSEFLSELLFPLPRALRGIYVSFLQLLLPGFQPQAQARNIRFQRNKNPDSVNVEVE